MPKVSAFGWKLQVGGAVAAPFELPYDDFMKLDRTELPVTIECPENPVGGGLVSHALWTGVSFESLLARAQPSADARAVRLTGADGFSRTIPLAKARHADTMIAHGMNSERLPEKHGFPMRALIPGWYGMDSVKWLQKIEVLAAEDNTPSKTAYVRTTRSLLLGVQPAGKVTAMNVKSAFSRPVDGAILTSRRFILRGAAWAGENRVKSVEVSTDSGKTWSSAALNGDPRPYVWTHWSLDWKIPGPGVHELAVRASDEAGRTQPATRARDRADDYELNSYQTIRVAVT